MAKGFKTGGRNFKPGQSGNPKGGPGLPGDLRQAKKLNRIEMERLLNKYLWITPGETKSIENDPTTSNMEQLVASIVNKAIECGDHARLDFLLNRLIGRVKDEIVVSTVKPYVINNVDGTQTILGAKPDLLPESEGLDWKDP